MRKGGDFLSRAKSKRGKQEGKGWQGKVALGEPVQISDQFSRPRRSDGGGGKGGHEFRDWQNMS